MQKIDRQLHKLDVAGKAPGRVASEAAVLLMGKNKANYLPNIDNGNFVEVSNINKMKFTGNKLDQKKYYSYSGYPGGLKEKKMKEVFQARPHEILYRAVYNMLPKNKLRKEFIKRLKFV
ncbi:50S ribosomal protein L13 [Candidatus Falkowbacteria bacterium RBG_13_39_14]|uniref:Large ribosomal subunit protein uL13 n=1 Tax=Candidatus Falkowbacteria bacterium RBG_13_39_14 TaxID=1797985 RepID=A0A1F5S8B6_9BACT|nr:MAG: 50S ribosomal protein L13 [Candidatus Falkowbacteria bacterium RBG_13_39_14]